MTKIIGKCINNCLLSVTKGQKYEITSENVDCYEVIDNDGDKSWYLKRSFEIIENKSTEVAEDRVTKLELRIKELEDGIGQGLTDYRDKNKSGYGVISLVSDLENLVPKQEMTREEALATLSSEVRKALNL